MGSGEAIDEVLEGRRQPHLISPASAAFIKLGNAQSQSKYGKDLISSTDNLVLSPVVIAMWKPMAVALGWGKKPIGWSEILALARSQKGWEAYGYPQWGRVKFGHTHPQFSNSGLISLFAEIYAASGKTVLLASSRPDLIEVDLKRPGRIDVKIPLFPTTTARESFDLIRMLLRKREINIQDSDFANFEPLMPSLLTPGAAETLAVKIYRLVRTSSASPLEALRTCLTDYLNPIPAEILEFQIRLAVAEASDLEFVPPGFRRWHTAQTDPGIVPTKN
jgi:Bacterial extracellular solute-binding protein